MNNFRRYCVKPPWNLLVIVDFVFLPKFSTVVREEFRDFAIVARSCRVIPGFQSLPPWNAEWTAKKFETQKIFVYLHNYEIITKIQNNGYHLLRIPCSVIKERPWVVLLQKNWNARCCVNVKIGKNFTTL